MYLNGKGISQDYNQAIQWFTKAERQNNANAQNSLGMMYLYGQGVSQNYNQAILWFTKAAEQGDSHALNNLGVMYSKGEGITSNHIIAYALFKLSGIDNSLQNNASKNHNLLIKNMTNEEIVVAQSLTRSMHTIGISKAITQYLKNKSK